MKTWLLLDVLLLGLFSGCRCSDQTPPPPSGLDDVRVAIESRRTRDLRVLFRPKDKIDDLERRRNCLIQVPANQSARLEIFVGTGLPLDKVILQVFGKKYDGQIKVISRDSITQTPRATYEPERQQSMQVYPGDLVIILGRD